MNEYQVPFALMSPGAVVEFEVFKGKPVLGVVKALTVYGARNMLAILSKSTDHEGRVTEGKNPHTGRRQAINLSHATRLVSPGQGPVVFEKDTDWSETRKRELATARAAGTLMRRGNRLIVDGTKFVYAPNLIESVVLLYIEENAQRLGIQPWEVLDFHRLMKVLEERGILRFDHAPLGLGESTMAVGAELHVAKMKSFIQRNINRLKLNTSAEEKARIEYENAEAELELD